MKKLGKKRYQDIETIEAYDIWGCADIVVCNCEDENVAFKGLNNSLYKYMRNKMME